MRRKPKPLNLTHKTLPLTEGPRGLIDYAKSLVRIPLPEGIEASVLIATQRNTLGEVVRVGSNRGSVKAMIGAMASNLAYLAQDGVTYAGATEEEKYLIRAAYEYGNQLARLVEGCERRALGVSTDGFEPESGSPESGS